MDLTNQGTQVNTGNDPIVIQRIIEDVPGGKSLDITGYTPTEIKAGHVVIKETANGLYKVHPVSGATYVATPGGHTIEGIVIASVRSSRAMVGILVKGRVNEAAAPYPFLAGHKTALTGITFTTD